MKKRKAQIIVALVIVLSFFSCIEKKDFDFDRLSSDIEVNPSFILPLLNTSMSVEDFVSFSNVNEGKAKISYLPDGLVAFSYSYTTTENIPYGDHPHEDFITTSFEGEISISLFDQNSSYGDIKFLLEDVSFELFTKTNASIKGCGIKDIVVTLFDDKDNHVTIPLDDIIFNIDKNVRSRVGGWNITEEFYKIVPHKLHYSFSLVYQKDQIEGVENGTIVNEIDGSLSFSLHGYMGGLKLLDTTRLNQTMEDLPDIEELDLHVVFENNFPFSFGTQIYFLDEDYRLRDSLFQVEEWIESAPVTNESASGISEKKVKVSYNSERAKNLQAARYIALFLKIETHKFDEEESVKIFRDNHLGINLIIEMEETINLNEVL